ncbi:MAG: nucleotidyltransferase domain-containing protein [Blautia sp.]|nr:nucleotidyltransferase domain-containing protein [Blautia sp.]
MPDNLSVLLKGYREAIVQIFGNQLSRVVLYGSYARGDFKQDSDMDIMILADVLPEEISRYADKVYDVTYDFEMQYGMEINPSVQSIQTYEQWKNVSPFFMNIEKDGVAV